MMLHGEIFCTKKGNYLRFVECGERLVRVRCGYADPEDIFTVYHLREIEGARAERATVGQLDYRPELDIDRYVLCCRCVEVQTGNYCPVFEAVRDAICAKTLAIACDDRDAKHRDRAAYIRGGDGHVGMIAPKFDQEFDFLPSNENLMDVCKGCKHSRYRTCGRRHKCEGDFERSHGSIISFFGRTFGRKEA